MGVDVAFSLSGNTAYRCSHCLFYLGYAEHFEDWNYCPKCGRELEG